MARPTKYKEEFNSAVDAYLQENQDSIDADSDIKVMLPTIEGLAAKLEVNKTTLYEWESKHPEFSNALDKIRAEQIKRLINEGLSGRYNPTIAKLMLANNYGYSDKQETDLKGTMKVEAIERTIIDPSA